ncbi:MAG: Hsp20 family protein [Alphaproteobacteria bacterium]|nr:Hsp20 family protein [Alphaproteobacteria bacterium]
MRTFDLTPLFRSTVGFDRLADMIDSVAQFDAGVSYPPYNIERTDENHYRISLAVAGFAEKDLSIEVKEGVLTVGGKRETDKDGKERHYLHQGIAGRNFERRFQLAENVEVRGANLENGLLHVDLERLVPEEKKPRRIVIGEKPDGKVIEHKAKAA